MRGAVIARKKHTVGRPKPDDRITIPKVYHRFFAANGHQQWWPGDSAFEVMVGAVLTRNTAWTNVEKAIANLKQAKALSPEAIVRPPGYFNIKAKRLKALCCWLIEQGGVNGLTKLSTHDLRHALLTVHGIGPETADDILLYAFNRPVFVIDTYTRRIFARLGLIAGDEPYEDLRSLFENELGLSPALFNNEYHALIVVHGKEVCKKRPRCGDCPLGEVCPSVISYKSTRD